MLSIDPARVLADLYRLRDFGRYETGVHRPSLSAEHNAACHWFAGRMAEAGLEPSFDGIGNVYGMVPGRTRKLLTGSHLESQNYAGWLDGPLGVVYGLEAARVINADPAFAGHGVDVAVWFDEEGHFGNFLGSRSFVDGLSDADVDAGTDRTDGRTLRDALAAAGLAEKPRRRVKAGEYIGYLEAHIEQGDWLEAHKLKIGIVTSIVGIWQFKVTFTGVQNHAGTTRMAIRKDAGLAAAELCCAIAKRFPQVAGERTVWTTGRITLDPGAPSIIPGRAEMLFQIRDADHATLKRMEAALNELVAASNKSGPCVAACEAIRKSYPAVMDAKFQAAFEAAAEHAAPGKHTRIPSGAGHDAQMLSKVMPAGMLFVPSIGGISHHWTENTSDEDIVTGAETFVRACRSVLHKTSSAT
jgi:beta-ureidopropionase / N-carbamoyl-L-amino-acid hydrolase